MWDLALSNRTKLLPMYKHICVCIVQAFSGLIPTRLFVPPIQINWISCKEENYYSN